GERGERLARAGLTDDPQPSARVQAPGGVVDDGAPVGGAHGQVTDVEEGHRASSGSRRSRMPSPSRLRPRTKTAMPRPGKTALVGAVAIVLCASRSMRP